MLYLCNDHVFNFYTNNPFCE